MKRLAPLMLAILLLLTPRLLYAETAMETMTAYINRVLEVLGDPALKGDAGKNEKTEKIRKIAEDLFDFGELSRRTLGKSWQQFSADQQTEFISLYKSLLQKNYSEKIVSYNDERIVFGKETTLSEKTSEIETTLRGKTADIPINDRLLLKSGKWSVYDVIIEGVSLINNYRSQFREILAKKPPEGLLDVLRNKVN